MDNTLELLSDLNIDEEFKRIVFKIIDSLNRLFTYATIEQDVDQKNAMMDVADFYISIINDSYKNNEDYQCLIQFLKDEVISRRMLFSKDFDISLSTSKKTKYLQ